MVLGTAGHIDHGKTTLVRALTGVDTDRLPEEKRRGITIDLGFAPLELPGVGVVGVVDVPGHEAFVRTMVAGATGVDLAMLVVAADEGVMPQTREHLAVLELLGVRHAVVALTKADLVDDDWLVLATDDVRATLDATAMRDAAIVPVSAATGAGLDGLRSALADAAARVAPRVHDDLFRLPVDRAFTVKGTGTVVSGTVWSGTLARDATVRLMPADVRVRVRGLHAFGRAVDAVHAGERAALALAGVDLADVHRGSVLVQGDAWRASRVLRADVAILGTAPRAIGSRARVRLHLGTSDLSARIVIPGGALAAGGAASARIVTDEPIVTRAGDRFVLRSESPVETIGGGVVTDPAASARARPWPSGDRTPSRLLDLVLDEAGAVGVAFVELPARLGVPPSQVDAVVAEAGAWRAGALVLAKSAHRSLREAALAAVERHHVEHALDAGVPAATLRSALRAPSVVASTVVEELLLNGALASTAGLLHRPDFTPHLDVAAGRTRDALLAALDLAGREPPSVDELAAALGEARERVLSIAHYLVRQGELVAVDAERFYLTRTLRELLGELGAAMEEGREYGAGELRDVLGVTRKFLIPLLEYCDAAGHTLRDEAGRRRRGRLLPGARQPFG